MFESLSDRFEGIFARLRSKGTLREADVDEVLREIRLALLEADVNFVVVKSMLGPHPRAPPSAPSIHEALNPAQQVIKIVNEELVEALGGESIRIQYASKPPTVVLMAGLQGSGKTTNSAKLARWFRQQGRNPLLVGADLQRPAAVEQLRTLGDQVGVPVFSQPGDPVDDGPGRRRRGPPPGPRRLHRRHRRSPRHRRRADGPGPPHLAGHQPRLHVPRRRRHDRPGRRHGRRVVRRDARRSTA